ncbi:phosphodiester glycosidase family protein [Paenibacillus sp. 481]|uniref:phosphodiester glycosidase family protein n=1 Tax=Paenibacillus sp. 481 TaxID=2835869 RepID=UPI001E31C8BB|nr:phosphodiester glycosidase family protein [Paenibacillus sp. 481]UHA72557.1 phosphodiester glycosidase family protein [Paenibacillus sp. 481]
MNTPHASGGLPPRRTRQHTTPNKKRPKQKRSIKKIIRNTFAIMLLLGVLGLGWLFFTPSGTDFRFLIADTLITTRHRHWAKYVIGQDQLDSRVQQYWKQFENMGDEKANHQITKPDTTSNKPKSLIEYHNISGEGYSGYLMVVNDPTKVRIGVPNRVGKGEKVSEMVKRTEALAGVNAGGFADPNWKGNGFQPIGVVIADGKVYYNGSGGMNKRTQFVGIDKDGKMIAGNYTVQQLMNMGAKEGVTFQPRIIVNGKGQIKSPSQGWGIAPRTVMGQREDGAILFLIIDGRQTHSIGANLYDCQQIMLEHGAVIAANLDGGSSTVLAEKGGHIKNSPASQYGERFLPSAFLVFEEPEQVAIKNIWEGLDPRKIDPGKW